MAEILSTITKSKAGACKVPFQASETLAKGLSAIGLAKRAPAGTTLFSAGEPATGVYLIRSGAVSAYLKAEDGREIVNRVLGPGTLLGVPAAMCSKSYAFTTRSMDDSTLVSYVDTNAFNEFLRTRPDLCMEVVLMMSDELLELRQSRDHMKTCTHHDCSLYESCRRCAS